MNLQTSNRRQDAPVRLGNHGYRLDGDYALLQAELHVPPYLSGQGFGLELWACPAAHAGGDLAGTKIAALPLDLPTPLGQHLHRVEARAPLSPPLGTGDHAVVLAVVSGAGESRRVHDYANYARLQHFAGPALHGAVAYAIAGATVELRADSVCNRRPEGNLSGSLCLELWALAQPYAGGSPRGHRLAVAELGSVSGQYHLPHVARRVPFTPPAPGRWHVALLLREWTLESGYVTRDHRGFDVSYEQPSLESSRISPESDTASRETSPLAQEPGARPASKLRSIEPAAVAATPESPPQSAALAAPSAPAGAPATTSVEAVAPAVVAPAVVAPAGATGTRLLSVNRASLDELAKLPGVSLKIAKEIVKGRPFASLDGLIAVRGIGEKTLRRIKSALTL